MGLGIREWMIVIGILLLLAVLLDGLRRMRRERHDQLQVAAKMGGGLKDVDADLPLARAGKPNARVKAHRETERSVMSPERERATALREASAGAAGSRGAPVNSPASPQPSAKPKVAAPTRPAPESARVELKKTDAPEPPAAEEIVIVNVLAKTEEGFNGADLLQILLACDMRFGKRKIFHRHEHQNGTGAIQFSMANLVEPGVFDLNNIEDFHTTGVSFFLSLPGPEDPIKAFDYMIETANCLVKNLDGELRDIERCAMTAQTVEHQRQRVREFERRQLTHST